MIDFDQYYNPAPLPKGADEPVIDEERRLDRLEYFRRKYFEKYLENYYESFTTQETMLDYIEKAEKGGLNDYFERAVDIYFSDERYKSHKLYSLANYDTIKEILSLIVFFSKVNFEYD